ncbi:hypothetical protein WMY93_017807 [Mugilogobius chulae]|uniref:TNase-like domain-containing protein n=1 Tax=Mugilogobius chulae TaxID=88201 RepID=A0AAW0NZH5_9GOBI
MSIESHWAETVRTEVLLAVPLEAGHGCTQNVNNMPPESAAGKDTGDRQQRHEAKQLSSNIVSLFSQFADDHLTLVRNLSTGLAVVGVIIIARSIKLMTKFHTASQIPLHFVERNVTLYGKVHSVTENSLAVEHVPVHVPVISSFLHKKHNLCPSLLQVHLAGVELTPEGRQWLQENLLPAKMVWIKLISQEDNILYCLVSQNKGVLRTYCINEELLRQGLARTAPITGLIPDSRLYWRLHRRLHRAEVKAERKNRGLWKEDSLWERAKKALRENRILSLIRRVLTKTPEEKWSLVPMDLLRRTFLGRVTKLYEDTAKEPTSLLTMSSRVVNRKGEPQYRRTFDQQQHLPSLTSAPWKNPPGEKETRGGADCETPVCLGGSIKRTGNPWNPIRGSGGFPSPFATRKLLHANQYPERRDCERALETVMGCGFSVAKARKHSNHHNELSVETVVCGRSEESSLRGE